MRATIMRFSSTLLCALLGCTLVLGFSTSFAHGADAASAWREIIALDAGPKREGLKDAASTDVYLQHLLLQEGALRKFIDLPDSGDKKFEAEFRLARVLGIRAELEMNDEMHAQAQAMLDALEPRASTEQRAHIAFTRITQWMRRYRFPDKTQRLDLLAAVREFRNRFPQDPRSARLLVEVATRFDREPEMKSSLLADAKNLTLDPALKQRIADDFSRLSLLGKQLKLGFFDTGGRPIQLESKRGNPVVILFFAENSPSSFSVWSKLNVVLEKYPKVGRIALSVDDSRAAMERARKDLSAGWTVGWEEGGWRSPLARRWGINAVPTAWLLDAAGRLVSLDAADALEQQLVALGQKG
jgi:hypothetical protein